MAAPLAERLRPQTLDDVVGQRHLLAPGVLLRRVIESGNVPNLIFYGPSGTGKSTVASIIARRAGKTLRKLNGTTASTADIRGIVGELDTFAGVGGVLLYLDEIQYFNKKQQQTLLEFLENGRITLVASTTENPYFAVYNALLSRSAVFEFKPVPPEETERAVERAFRFVQEERGAPVEVSPEVKAILARGTGGDVRKAVNAVEMLALALPKGPARISEEDARAVAQRSALRYDRDGDEHYDILSALQKSVRGSDPDAAVHYLARLLDAGDLLSPCRRLLVMASEDVGLAYPTAVAVVKACVDSALQLGLPEARIPLAQAAVFLATCPKSNSAVCAIERAEADIQAGKSGPIPENLRDAHYQGAAKLGHGAGYLYPHDFPNHWVRQRYLPDALSDARYYEYGDDKIEQAAKGYWEKIKGQDKKE